MQGKFMLIALRVWAKRNAADDPCFARVQLKRQMHIVNQKGGGFIVA